MGRYFLECEIDPHDGSLYWLPLFVDADGRGAASDQAAAMLATLGQRFTVTRSTEPRPWFHGLQPKLTAYYAATGLRGRPRPLSLDDGSFQPVRGETAVLFDRRLTLQPLPARARLDQVQAGLGSHRVAVRVLSPDTSGDVMALSLTSARATRSAV